MAGEILTRVKTQTQQRGQSQDLPIGSERSLALLIRIFKNPRLPMRYRPSFNGQVSESSDRIVQSTSPAVDRGEETLMLKRIYADRQCRVSKSLMVRPN
ncbi:hypothetical protein PMIT1313_00027 [Prochlorococcus marinus str. MIT 1313]|nr:hypothetical protein PMIT1313_00027 [Prochlorococcus marinus str. MIT 1313]KZR75202.1 hypothetical protein PMIT1318_00287 [Prochlorococcus marinus str. MIT 1318]